MQFKVVLGVCLCVGLAACGENADVSDASGGASSWSSGGGAGDTTANGGATAASGGTGGSSATTAAGGTAAATSIVIVATGDNGGILGRFSSTEGWSTTPHDDGSNDAPAIAMHDDGSALAALHRSSDNLLRVAHFDGSAWDLFGDVAATITTRAAPSLAAASGVTHVAFHGTDYKHYYAQFSQGAWSPQGEAITPQGAAQSYGPTAARMVHTAGAPHIGFTGDDQKVYIQARTGGSWQAAQALATSKSLSQPATTRLDGGGGGDIMIVYVHNEPSTAQHTQLMWSQRSGGEWSLPQIINDEIYGSDGAALAPLDDGAALLAYRGSDGRGYSSRYTPGAEPSWTPATPLSPSNPVLDSVPCVAAGTGSSDAELAAIINGAAVQFRYENDTWSAPVAIGGAGLKHIAIASRP
jgi:hypothetical protein